MNIYVLNKKIIVEAIQCPYKAVLLAPLSYTYYYDTMIIIHDKSHLNNLLLLWIAALHGPVNVKTGKVKSH